MPTDEQMMGTADRRARLRMKPRAPVPSSEYFGDSAATPDAPVRTGYGAQNAPGAGEYMDTASAGPPAPTAPGYPSSADKPDLNALREQLRGRMHLADAKLRQARIASGRGLAAGADPNVAQAEAEFRAAQQDFANVHRALAPSVLDQTPEQIAAGQESLKRQYRQNVDQIRTDNSMNAVNAVDLAAKATADAHKFFLGDYGDTAPHAQGLDVLTDPYGARDRAAGVAQVRARSAMRGAQEANRVEAQYNPPAEFTPEPISPDAMAAKRADRDALRARMMGETLPAFRAAQQAERETAGTVAQIPPAAAETQLAQVRAAGRVAAMQGTAADVGALQQQGAAAVARTQAAHQIAGFNPDEWYQGASELVQKANEMRGLTTSGVDTDRLMEALQTGVIAPLERLAQVNPEEARRQAERILPAIDDSTPLGSQIIASAMSVLSPAGSSFQGALAGQAGARSAVKEKLRAIGKLTK